MISLSRYTFKLTLKTYMVTEYISLIIIEALSPYIKDEIIKMNKSLLI